MTSLADCMVAAEMSVDDLVRESGLDKRVVELIVAGSYTPSPGQRNLIATALGVDREVIAWGHTIEVQHLRGNGPQFGRST